MHTANPYSDHRDSMQPGTAPAPNASQGYMTSGSSQNKLAQTHNQFRDYHNLKSQINTTYMKNTAKDFYLSTSPDPSGTINKRVKTINDEIAKQRQYLPNYQPPLGGRKLNQMSNVVINHPKPSNPKFIPVGNTVTAGLASSSAVSSEAFDEGAAMTTGLNTTGLNTTMGVKQAPRRTNSTLKHQRFMQNNFQDNLELLNHHQNLQMTLVDKSGKIKNISMGANYSAQGIFNKQQEVETRNRMLREMHQMPTSIGIYNRAARRRPQVDSFADHYQTAVAKHNLIRNSSLTRHGSQNLRLGPNRASNLQAHARPDDGLGRPTKKARRNIKPSYFDKVAKDMTNKLNSREMGESEQHFDHGSYMYDTTQDLYEQRGSMQEAGRLPGGFKAKTPQKHNKKMGFQNAPHFVQTQQRFYNGKTEGLSPLVPNEGRLPYTKLQSPSYGNNDSSLRIPSISSPQRGGAPVPQESPVGYVNYINGVPIDVSPDIRRKGKGALVKNQRLPKLKPKARGAQYATAGPNTGTHDDPPQESPKKKAVRNQQSMFKIKNGRNVKNSVQIISVRDESKEASIQKDEEYANERERLLASHDKMAKKKSKSPAKKRVKMLDDEPASQPEEDQRQVNIILPSKQSHKKPRRRSPEYRMATVSSGKSQSIPKMAVHSMLNTTDKLQHRRTHRSNQSSAQRLHGVRSVSSTKKPGSSQRGKGSQKKSRTSSYGEGGPLPQRSIERGPQSTLHPDPKYFKKFPSLPGLFQLDVNENDFEHLLHDDLDEVSRFEVVYKILKDQLRGHQKQLIKMKEEQKEAKLEKQRERQKSRKDLKLTPQELSKFARQIKHFELYGPQRGLAPDIKRIIKNLTCQEHHFMYCPCCKKYDDVDFDPVRNIRKFMAFIKKEQNKLKSFNRKQIGKHQKRNARSKPRQLPDDSLSEITDIEKEEVLAKYMQANMTKAELKAQDRQHTRDRLYGAQGFQHKHICSTTHGARPASAEPKLPTVKMELRELEDGLSMQDEENSAHQFSLKDISVQADSEARLDAEMQTSAIEYRSHQDQTSKQNARSIVQQTSDIDIRSNHNQTSNFGDFKAEMGCQTDPKITRSKTPVKRNMKLQTEKPRHNIDKYKDDWVNSIVFKRAVRDEGRKRGLAVEEVETDEEDSAAEITDNTSYTNLKSLSMFKQPQSGAGRRPTCPHGDRDDSANVSDLTGDQENAQDADTDYIPGRDTAHQHALGFLKKIQEKGNIQKLTESEIRYLKKLLKEKNHRYWTEQTTLNDVYRHTKYTIRKLTYLMANIDNYKIFKKCKEPNREHTIYLVYRAERLYSAVTDSQKVFSLISQTLYDAERFQDIVDTKSIKKEDQIFVKKREILFKRIMAQLNNFLEGYRLFNNNFIFKGQPLREYVMIELEKCTQGKELMEATKKANPELAAREDSRKVTEVKKSKIGLLRKQNNEVSESKDINSPNLVTDQSQQDIQVASPNLLKKKINYDSEVDFGSPEVKNKQKAAAAPMIQIQDNNVPNVGSITTPDTPTRDKHRIPKDATKKIGPQVEGNIQLEQPKSLSPLQMNRYAEQDVVGKRTIEIINEEVKSEAGGAMSNKHHTPTLDRKNQLGKSMKSMARLDGQGAEQEGCLEIQVEDNKQIGKADDFEIGGARTQKSQLKPLLNLADQIKSPSNATHGGAQPPSDYVQRMHPTSLSPHQSPQASNADNSQPKTMARPVSKGIASRQVPDSQDESHGTGGTKEIPHHRVINSGPDAVAIDEVETPRLGSSNNADSQNQPNQQDA